MKERIIGAVVLVVFVVLVVPIFLNGPPGEDEIISERVLLPGQEDQKMQKIVLDRDRTEPVPAASTTVPAREEPARDAPVHTEPAPAAAAQQEPRKVPDTAREPAPEQAMTSTTGMWAVQLGSFSNKDNAEKLAADLRKQGYAAFLSQLSTANGQLHRVRVGPQKDRESAAAMAKRLAKVGHPGQVVPQP